MDRGRYVGFINFPSSNHTHVINYPLLHSQLPVAFSEDYVRTVWPLKEKVITSFLKDLYVPS